MPNKNFRINPFTFYKRQNRSISAMLTLKGRPVRIYPYTSTWIHRGLLIYWCICSLFSWNIITLKPSLIPLPRDIHCWLQPFTKKSSHKMCIINYLGFSASVFVLFCFKKVSKPLSYKASQHQFLRKCLNTSENNALCIGDYWAIYCIASSLVFHLSCAKGLGNIYIFFIHIEFEG